MIPILEISLMIFQVLQRLTYLRRPIIRMWQSFIQPNSRERSDINRSSYQRVYMQQRPKEDINNDLWDLETGGSSRRGMRPVPGVIHADLDRSLVV